MINKRSSPLTPMSSFAVSCCTSFQTASCACAIMVSWPIDGAKRSSLAAGNCSISRSRKRGKRRASRSCSCALQASMSPSAQSANADTYRSLKSCHPNHAILPQRVRHGVRYEPQQHQSNPYGASLPARATILLVLTTRIDKAASLDYLSYRALLLSSMAV